MKPLLVTLATLLLASLAALRVTGRIKSRQLRAKCRSRGLG